MTLPRNWERPRFLNKIGTGIFCALILGTLVSILCVNGIGLKWFGNTTYEVFFRRTLPPWTNTLDAHEPCSQNQWKLPQFYKDGNISCNESKLVSFQKVNGTFTEFKEETESGVKCPREPVLTSLHLPTTALASYPGSGNTWTRHLLQQLTGIHTGALYFSLELLKDGFLGEGVVDKVIAIKTHLTAVRSTKFWRFDRQFLIIRNPFDSVVAEYKRHALRAGHRKHVNISVNKGWIAYARESARKWSHFIRTALIFPNPQLVVFYEDLKTCLLRELLRIASFLRTGELSSFSVCCALGNSQGRNYRNQEPADISQLLFQGQITDMNDMLTTLAEDIKAHFPVLAKRLLKYRFLGTSNLT